VGRDDLVRAGGRRVEAKGAGTGQNLRVGPHYEAETQREQRREASVGKEGGEPHGSFVRLTVKCTHRSAVSGQDISEWGKIGDMGKEMAEVAKVDDRGRIRLPRGMAQPGGSVVIVGSRSYFLGIPIPPDPLQRSGSWLRVKEDVTSLKRRRRRRQPPMP